MDASSESYLNTFSMNLNPDSRDQHRKQVHMEAVEYSESGLLAKMRSVCGRYENLVRVLNEVLVLCIEDAARNDTRSKYVDLLSPIKHYDPKLYEMVQRLDMRDTGNTRDRKPYTLVAESMMHSDVHPPSISPEMGSLSAVLASVSKENRQLIEKWNITSQYSFDYVCIRLYKLKGTRTLGTRDVIPSPGVFITVNSLVNSTLAPDGDWCGETMTVPFSDTNGVRIDLRTEDGTVIAQSVVLQPKDFQQDTREVVLGTDWTLSVGIVLGMSPSSVYEDSSTTNS